MKDYLENNLKKLKDIISDLEHCDIDFTDELLSLEEIEIRLTYEIEREEEE